RFFGDSLDSSHPITIVYKILKSKKKCSGCDKFTLVVNFCSSQCVELYQIKLFAMQEINNKFQETNLHPASESMELVNAFFNLFDIRVGLNDDCPHDVPFTRQCNNASSIQRTI